MDRAIGRGPAWIWPALTLGLGAVAAGVGCGVATEPAPPSSGLSPRYAVACEGDASDCDGGTDGGRDGGPDSGHDGGHDGGTDGGHDGGTDGGHDGGHDGGQDGGPDGGHDGGTDGGCDAAAMQAAALRGEAVDPGACKWNIPPDTRNVVPINKIYDVGPANLIVKSQEAQTTDYEICSVDNKKTSSGSIQGCWRYAANLMGACVAGSGGSTTEDGTCQTPFCPCDGADGECREPSCTMHKDNKQYGAGGGINLGLYQAKNIPLIGRFIPWSQGFNVNANVIIQLGYGFGQDDRNGSALVSIAAPTGTPRRTTSSTSTQSSRERFSSPAESGTFARRSPPTLPAAINTTSSIASTAMGRNSSSMMTAGSSMPRWETSTSGCA
jgi:hypothetical protein